MSLPEISQRCLSCGAATRAGVRFCPQCGAQIGVDGSAIADHGVVFDEQPAEKELVAKEPVAHEDDLHFEEEWKKFEERSIRHAGRETKTDDAGGVIAPLIEPLREDAPPVTASSTAATELSTHTTDAVADARATQTFNAAPHDGSTARGVPMPTAETSASPEGGRAAAAIRDSVRPRVERVRAASTNVIEEASEDSGLRFVLIAVLLFILFLLFLLLSTILK